MSLSRPNAGPKSPATKYIQFSGRRVIDNEEEGEFTKPTDGKFYYYDKKEEKNIPIEDMPPFIVLDGYGFNSNLFSFSGWIDSYKAYCWSNEVRSHEDKMVVRLFDKSKTKLAEGTYTDIAKEVKDLGGKYTKCLYIMLAGTKEICHLKCSGGSLSSWLEIDSEEQKFQERYVIVKDIVKGKKGATKFWKCEFDFGSKFSDEDLANAIELDKQLQEYLDGYLVSDHSKAPVYDREDTNTDSWAFVAVEGDDDERELGELSLDELNKIRENLEEENQEDGTYYQFVCRACKEKREEQKEKEEDKPKTEKKDPKDLFKKKKTDEKKEEPAYKSVELPDGRTVGDLDKDEVSELISYIEKEDLKEDYSELYEALQDAIADSNVPF